MYKNLLKTDLPLKRLLCSSFHCLLDLRTNGFTPKYPSPKISKLTPVYFEFDKLNPA